MAEPPKAPPKLSNAPPPAPPIRAGGPAPAPQEYPLERASRLHTEAETRRRLEEARRSPVNPPDFKGLGPPDTPETRERERVWREERGLPPASRGDAQAQDYQDRREAVERAVAAHNPPPTPSPTVDEEALQRYGYRQPSGVLVGATTGIPVPNHGAPPPPPIPPVANNPAGSPKPDQPDNGDKDFWVVITIGGAALGAGLYFLGVKEWIFGGVLTSGSLFVLAPASPFIRRLTGRFTGRRALWALGVTTWLFLAANIGLTINRPDIQINQQPTPAAERPVVPTTQQTAYINPLHDDVVKLQIMRNIILASQKAHQKCHVTIVRYQLPYAEDYAADLKDVLTLIDWPFDEVFATSTLPRGLSLRILQEGSIQQNAFCSNTLGAPIANYGRTRTGNHPAIGYTSLTSAQSPSYLKNCMSSCVEVDIGNEEP